MSTTLVESVTFASGRVDRANGVIRNCLLAGAKSKNGRRYASGVYKKAAKLYEGRSVFMNHHAPSRYGEYPDRDLGAKLGWVQDVTIGRDGLPRGDFHILKSHPAANQVFEMAERNPSQLGFSHVVSARTRPDYATKEEVIESIEEVTSIDLVASPATTKGLFESTMPTIRKLCERLNTPRSRALRRLCEAADLLNAPAPSSGGVLEGLQAAANAVLAAVFAGEKDLEAGLKMIRSIAKLADPMGVDDDGDDPDPEPDPMAEEPVGGRPEFAEESHRRRVHLRGELREAMETGDAADILAFIRGEAPPSGVRAMNERLRVDRSPAVYTPWRPMFG